MFCHFAAHCCVEDALFVCLHVFFLSCSVLSSQGQRTFLCVTTVWCLLVLCDHRSLARSVCLMRPIRCPQTTSKTKISSFFPSSSSFPPFFRSETWHASAGHLKLTRSLEVNWENRSACREHSKQRDLDVCAWHCAEK